MTSVRAFVGIGGLLVAMIAPAALLGGCTMQSVSAGGGMTQPAPRARRHGDRRLFRGVHSHRL